MGEGEEGQAVGRAGPCQGLLCLVGKAAGQEGPAAGNAGAYTDCPSTRAARRGAKFGEGRGVATVGPGEEDKKYIHTLVTHLYPK